MILSSETAPELLSKIEDGAEKLKKLVKKQPEDKSGKEDDNKDTEESKDIQEQSSNH